MSSTAEEANGAIVTENESNTATQEAPPLNNENVESLEKSDIVAAAELDNKENDGEHIATHAEQRIPTARDVAELLVTYLYNYPEVNGEAAVDSTTHHRMADDVCRLITGYSASLQKDASELSAKVERLAHQVDIMAQATQFYPEEIGADDKTGASENTNDENQKDAPRPRNPMSTTLNQLSRAAQVLEKRYAEIDALCAAMTSIEKELAYLVTIVKTIERPTGVKERASGFIKSAIGLNKENKMTAAALAGTWSRIPLKIKLGDHPSTEWYRERFAQILAVAKANPSISESR